MPDSDLATAPPRPQQTSLTALHEQALAMEADGKSTYRLGRADSPFPIPEVLTQALGTGAGQRRPTPALGLESLRRAVAHYAERKSGIDRTRRDVLIGPGMRQLAFLLRLVFRGQILLPTPSWSAYGQQGEVLGQAPTLFASARSESWLPSPESLDQICRATEGPKLAILNSPANPSGATFQPDTLKALAQVAREHELLILSDEVYGELHHKGAHVSISRYYPEATIIATGLSKWCGAEGWRIGSYIFPDSQRQLQDSMAEAGSLLYGSTCTPIQHAAVAAFEGSPEIDAYLGDARRVLSALGRLCTRLLRKANLDLVQPTGGFCLYPDFKAHREALAQKGVTTSAALASLLLQETGVESVPASALGRPEDDLCLRLAYVDFDGASALSGAGVVPLEQPLDQVFLTRHCPRVVTAMEQIGGFCARL